MKRGLGVKSSVGRGGTERIVIVFVSFVSPGVVRVLVVGQLRSGSPVCLCPIALRLWLV